MTAAATQHSPLAMRWTLEILVFLVFAGMALPIIWRMRGLSILRSALSHEPLYMRVAAFAFFAATVIYGGGKGEMRSENGEWKNENGEWKSENGELRTTPTFNFQLSILQTGAPPQPCLTGSPLLATTMPTRTATAFPTAGSGGREPLTTN